MKKKNPSYLFVPGTQFIGINGDKMEILDILYEPVTSARGTKYGSVKKALIKNHNNGFVVKTIHENLQYFDLKIVKVGENTGKEAYPHGKMFTLR